MEKEEILMKSRQAFKNKELHALEVVEKGGNYGAIVAMILATIFFVVQILVGSGMNYGLYAVVFSIPATGYLVKAKELKQRKDRVLAVIYILATLIFSIIHIHQLIMTSEIL